VTGYVLVAFGFCWMVVAALIGLYLGAKHQGHIEQLEAAANSGNLASYHQAFEAYKWRSTVHAHGMLFSLSSAGVGLLLTPSGSGIVFFGTEAVVGTLISATVVWTLAALRRMRPLMGLADLLFIGAIAVVAASVASAV